MKRSDMACDFLPHEQRNTPYVHAYTVDVDARLSRELHRPPGRYCTVECAAVRERNRSRFGEIADALSTALGSFVPAPVSTVLVVGLGNPRMTADSLGAAVCARITATRALPSSDAKTNIGVLLPNVSGVTGIESFDVVSGVTQRIRPDCIVAVDSLASAATSRIAAAFQATDTGITPGSGVSNHRERLCRESLGVPVLSLGVPLVVYASTIIEDATGKQCPAQTAEGIGRLLVTPKDIDVYVEDCAEIIATAIASAFTRG